LWAAWSAAESTSWKTPKRFTTTASITNHGFAISIELNCCIMSRSLCPTNWSKHNHLTFPNRLAKQMTMNKTMWNLFSQACSVAQQKIKFDKQNGMKSGGHGTSATNPWHLKNRTCQRTLNIWGQLRQALKDALGSDNMTNREQWQRTKKTHDFFHPTHI